jgi:hypothetical protein
MPDGFGSNLANAPAKLSLPETRVAIIRPTFRGMALPIAGDAGPHPSQLFNHSRKFGRRVLHSLSTRFTISRVSPTACFSRG